MSAVAGAKSSPAWKMFVFLAITGFIIVTINEAWNGAPVSSIALVVDWIWDNVIVNFTQWVKSKSA
jgi:hypothetical protein